MSSTVEQADAHTPGKGHSATITVNNKAVEIIGPRVTGLQIKEAAIAQGVQIELDFQLSQELPSGETRIIGDTDVVTVNKNSVFTAVAGDDNS
ncbi:multiubiquitin domain-containing protein [Streptomyces sp. NPDC088747]|uniref:multiubiquitin domain-containing protein n=1 Tax=Streptomyces sp. NPDC088747 TaxID=3365886 RepID=UPI00381D5C96